MTKGVTGDQVSGKVDMADLLQAALEAHGGINHWIKFQTVKAEASITAPVWAMKGQADILKHANISALIDEQHLTTHLRRQNKRTVYVPELQQLLDGGSELQTYAYSNRRTKHKDCAYRVRHVVQPTRLQSSREILVTQLRSAQRTHSAGT
jgi:hypothetical protein